MAWTCTVNTSPSNCGHRTATIVRDDGSSSVFHLEGENVPFTAEEEQTLVTLTYKRLRQQGLSHTQIAGRVLIGSEATNVRAYDFFGPGAAITKTNIGVNYVNVPVGANGERIRVDLTGVTEFRGIVSANLVGTGPFGLRIVRDSDNAVLFENPTIALTGEREFDTDWQPLPLAAGGQEFMRLQAKSVTASDDPVFRRATLLLR